MCVTARPSKDGRVFNCLEIDYNSKNLITTPTKVNSMIDNYGEQVDVHERNCVLCDSEILELCEEQAMITPFEDHVVRTDPLMGRKVVSYGLGSYGYDVRMEPTVKLMTNDRNAVLDPKKVDGNAYVDLQADNDGAITIPPHGVILVSTTEYIKMPKDVVAIVQGKSTYSRVGLQCLCTPLEPGWEGNITMAMANTTPLPLRIYAKEGVAQILFFRGNKCDVNYADRGGKYQGQKGITTSRM